MLQLVTSAYVAVSIIAACVDFFLVPSFREVGHLQVGCYTYDAVMVGVSCRGFPGAALAEFILSLPWGQLQVPYVAFDGLVGVFSLGPDELLFVVLAIMASVVLWAPVAYPVWYLFWSHKNA
jgi:hypothetical protein